MKKNNHGFTLAELLIVVAIIAVLVAVAIPVFNTQLEKSRQATDLANLRSSYAEAMANYLSNNAADADGSDYKMQNKNNKLDLVDLSALQSDLASALTSSTTLTSGSEYHVHVAAPTSGSGAPTVTIAAKAAAVTP